ICQGKKEIGNGMIPLPIGDMEERDHSFQDPEKADPPDQDQRSVQGWDGLKIGNQCLHSPNIGNQRVPRRSFMASTIWNAAGQMATFLRVRGPICWNFFRLVWGNSRQALGLWS